MENAVSAKKPSDYLKRYREQGLMLGVFLWLDSLERSINEITSLSFHRDVKEIKPATNGWKRWEPLPDTHVTLTFADGSVEQKTFTQEQFRGES